MSTNSEWRLKTMKQIMAMSNQFGRLHNNFQLPPQVEVKLEDETLSFWGKQGDAVIYCAICKTPDSYDFNIRHKFDHFYGPCPCQTEAQRFFIEALNHLKK